MLFFLLYLAPISTFLVQKRCIFNAHLSLDVIIDIGCDCNDDLNLNRSSCPDNTKTLLHSFQYNYHHRTSIAARVELCNT